MNSFPVLKFVSTALAFLGWLVVIAGAVIAVAAMVVGDAFFFGRVGGVIAGVIVVFSGLVGVALGESIGVLFAIEDNTRRAAERR